MLKLKEDNDIINFFNKLILNELKEFDCWVAGGSILSYIDNKPINDLDIYFKNKEEREHCLGYLIKNNGIVSMDNINTTKIFYNNKTLDILKIYFESPQVCIDSFDFSICGIATDGDVVYKVSDFDNHWKKKLIVHINYTNTPPQQFDRVQKYLTKGYRIDKKETVDLLRRLRLSTDEEIKEWYGI